MYKNKEKKGGTIFFCQNCGYELPEGYEITPQIIKGKDGRASARPAGSGIRLRKNRQHQRPRAEAAEEVPEKSGNQLP